MSHFCPSNDNNRQSWSQFPCEYPVCILWISLALLPERYHVTTEWRIFFVNHLSVDNRTENTTSLTTGKCILFVVGNGYNYPGSWDDLLFPRGLSDKIWLMLTSVRHKTNHLLIITSSNGNIFCATGRLSGKALCEEIHWALADSRHKGQCFDVFYASLNKRLSKQSRCWWFETPMALIVTLL